MRLKTIIYVRWIVSGRIEHFTNLGKLYSIHSEEELGVSRHTLNKKDLFDGYKNKTVEVRKFYLF
jgi:hypothetical protein